MFSKSFIKKHLKDWGVILTVIAILYFTGLHSEVAAFAQRIVLSTGIITPSQLPVTEMEKADYNMKLRTLDGEILNFEDYKNKVVFINFWATWCAPCIAEMPNIQSLYEKIDSENIKFVMISLDRNTEKARKFIEKKGFTFPVYEPVGYLPDVYYASELPTTFVISPEGQIVTKKVGMANYDKKGFLNYLYKLSGEK